MNNSAGIVPLGRVRATWGFKFGTLVTKAAEFVPGAPSPCQGCNISALRLLLSGDLGDRDGIVKDRMVYCWSPHCIDEKADLQRSDLLTHIFIFKRKKIVSRSSGQFSSLSAHLGIL